MNVVSWPFQSCSRYALSPVHHARFQYGTRGCPGSTFLALWEPAYVAREPFRNSLSGGMNGHTVVAGSLQGIAARRCAVTSPGATGSWRVQAASKQRDRASFLSVAERLDERLQP